MSRTQLAFNSSDLVFQEIITSRPYHNSATRVVFPERRLARGCHFFRVRDASDGVREKMMPAAPVILFCKRI